MSGFRFPNLTIPIDIFVLILTQLLFINYLRTLVVNVSYSKQPSLINGFHSTQINVVIKVLVIQCQMDFRNIKLVFILSN